VQAEKHLACLADAGKIKLKENGKSKIYYADQDAIPELSASEMQQLDANIASTRAMKQRLSQQVAELQRTLKTQGARKSKAQLQEQERQLRAEVEKSEAELQSKKAASGGAALSAQQTAEVKKLYMMLHKEFLVRRRKCVDALDRVAEGMEMRPKDLMKKLGLESDDDAGVNYKAFPKVFA